MYSLIFVLIDLSISWLAIFLIVAQLHRITLKKQQKQKTLFRVFFYIKPSWSTHMLNWLIDIFFALDRTLNVVAGGGRNSTISARVGYHITERPSWHSRFWFGLARMIDSTFKPLDGAGHCVQAYASEHGNYKTEERGSDVARALLGVIVFASCLILWPLIRWSGAIQHS